MSKHNRTEDASLLDDEPSLKKQKTEQCYVWFNKVPSQITSWILQQHLWSKYRLNAQPHLKATTHTESYFYIEISAKQADALLNKSPLTIKGHKIILSTQMIMQINQQLLNENENKNNNINTIQETNEKLCYKISINNVPFECTKIELTNLFNTYGTIFAIHCNNNNDNTKKYKTVCIDFENIESLVNIAMALSIGALKIKQDLLHITIDSCTVDYLYKNKYDSIISDLIKFNLINPIASGTVEPEITVENIIKKDTNIKQDEDDDDDDDDDVSICDDEESSEMSISPNIITSDIKIMNVNTNTNTNTNNKAAMTCLIAGNNQTDANDLSESDLELKTLTNEFEKEKNEFNKLYEELRNYTLNHNTELEEGEDDQRKELVQLREKEMKLSDMLLDKENEYNAIKMKLEILETELNQINKEIETQELKQKQQQITNEKEYAICNRNEINQQNQLDVLNKSNKNLQETINNLKIKNEKIKINIENAKIAKAKANANCIGYENELKVLDKKLNENKMNYDGNKAKMQNKMNIMKSNLEIEQSKHAKSKLLLKQTVDSIQENLAKINNKNKEKDDLIFSLQKELQNYQAQYPWLMTL